MYRSEDVREALRIAVQRGNDTAAWNSGMDRKQVVEEAEALFEELVPVKALDTNDAEREGIDSPWFEVGPIYLPKEKRDKFRVAVFGIGDTDE